MRKENEKEIWNCKSLTLNLLKCVNMPTVFTDDDHHHLQWWKQKKTRRRHHEKSKLKSFWRKELEGDESGRTLCWFSRRVRQTLISDHDGRIRTQGAWLVRLILRVTLDFSLFSFLGISERRFFPRLTPCKSSLLTHDKVCSIHRLDWMWNMQVSLSLFFRNSFFFYSVSSSWIRQCLLPSCLLSERVT